MRRRLLMQSGESLAPVYLVVGANGDVGVETYEYLWATYGSTHVYPASEEIYISEGDMQYKLNMIQYSTSHGIYPSCGEGIQIVSNGGSGYVLLPNGDVVYVNWEIV